MFRQPVLSGILLQSPGSKMPIIVNCSAGEEFETIRDPWFRWQIKEEIAAVLRSHKVPPACFLIRIT